MKLNRVEIKHLFSLYSKDRTTEMRNILIKLNTDLATKCAIDFQRCNNCGVVEFEDINQQAMLGLIAAVDRYNPSYGKAFSSFAIPTINGKIKQYIRDKSNLVRVPQSIQNLYIEICRYRKSKDQEPSIKQLALHFNVSESAIQEATNHYRLIPYNSEEDLSLFTNDRNIAYSNQEEIIERLLNLGLEGIDLWQKINEGTK